MLNITDTTVNPCHHTHPLVEKLQTASHHYYTKDKETEIKRKVQ